MLCLLAPACRPGRPAGPPQPTLASIQERVFDLSCIEARCHAGQNPETSLDLRAGRSYAGLVRAQSSQIGELLRVAPGDPDRSYLIRKLEGTAIVGEAMPGGRARLPPETIAAIRRWIADGAAPD